MKSGGGEPRLQQHDPTTEDRKEPEGKLKTFSEVFTTQYFRMRNIYIKYDRLILKHILI